MAIIIGRPAGGIAVNGPEHALGDDGRPLTFETEESAQAWLRDQGVSDEEMDFLIFTEYQEPGAEEPDGEYMAKFRFRGSEADREAVESCLAQYVADEFSIAGGVHGVEVCKTRDSGHMAFGLPAGLHS